MCSWPLSTTLSLRVSSRSHHIDGFWRHACLSVIFYAHFSNFWTRSFGPSTKTGLRLFLFRNDFTWCSGCVNVSLFLMHFWFCSHFCPFVVWQFSEHDVRVSAIGNCGIRPTIVQPFSICVEAFIVSKTFASFSDSCSVLLTAIHLCRLVNELTVYREFNLRAVFVIRRPDLQGLVVCESVQRGCTVIVCVYVENSLLGPPSLLVSIIIANFSS